MLPSHLHPFLVCLRSLQYVVEACFGMHLYPEYKDLLQDFKKSYEDLILFCSEKLNLVLTIPWKVHILVIHVPQFLTMNSDFGLGVYAEQVIESSHSRMKPTLKRYSTLKHFS